jgi:hypothetical protein
MFQILESHNSVFTLSRKIIDLSQRQAVRITNKMLRGLREEYREEAMREISTFEQNKKGGEETSDPFKGKEVGSKAYKSAQNLQRLKFLNKFQMMSGSNKLTSVVNQSLNDPKNFFKCDHEKWPICLFDFTYKHVLPSYFCFWPKPGHLTVFDDHFYGKDNFMKDHPPLHHPKDLPGSVMIERNFHVCREPAFQDAFINLYLSCDLDFFRCNHLKISKVAKATQARGYLEKFMQHVASRRVVP